LKRRTLNAPFFLFGGGGAGELNCWGRRWKTQPEFFSVSLVVKEAEAVDFFTSRFF
jgi:hypothetical protein